MAGGYAAGGDCEAALFVDVGAGGGGGGEDEVGVDAVGEGEVGFSGFCERSEQRSEETTS